MAESAGLFRPKSLQPFYTEERCHIVEHFNTPESPDVSMAECRVAVGVTTQLHSLTIAERYIVQRGVGRMELAGNDLPNRQIFDVHPGDCVLIPPGCAQRIMNICSEELVFYCICTPRFEPSHYVALENDGIEDIADRG